MVKVWNVSWPDLSDTVTITSAVFGCDFGTSQTMALPTTFMPSGPRSAPKSTRRGYRFNRRTFILLTSRTRRTTIWETTWRRNTSNNRTREFHMRSFEWERLKNTLAIGDKVQGIVVAHQPYGVFVELSMTTAQGLIEIPNFKDVGRMTPDQYPALGTTVVAVVLGFKESGNQVWLGVKPSQLATTR